MENIRIMDTCLAGGAVVIATVINASCHAE